MDQPRDATDSSASKRKRSLSIDAQSHSLPPAKHPRTASAPNHLQINYLVRQNPQDLPLISVDDTLTSILTVINDYQGVLDRHESLACNLGARPLGPILIKRFERLFDGPPKVLKGHTSKDGTPVMVNWLDVVDFARTKPEQFTLGQMSEGVRVCQFYTRQCRVQISEEDFLLIGSGMPQKLIPPQPIAEDEEKELGTLEIIERNIGQITHLADQVAARARQFNHRLRGRKQAIIERRASEPAVSGAVALRASSPSNVALMNGAPLGASAPLSPSGFVAVNSRHAVEPTINEPSPSSGQIPDPTTVSQTTRDELVKSFFTLSDLRQNCVNNPTNNYAAPPAMPSPSRTSQVSSKSAARPVTVARSTTNYEDQHLVASLLSYIPDSSFSSAAVAPNTPVSLIQRQAQPRSSPADRDDGGPFRAMMVARLESLAKGDRIIPPCDRCRRLHMDCLKNLTACVGCTKKHAKCSWRDVQEDEIRGTDVQHLRGVATDFATDEDASMLEGESTTLHDHLQRFAASDEQQHMQQHQHQHQQTQGYAHAAKFRSHDDEMQAARSLAMAAVADAATQAQMLMQRDDSVAAPDLKHEINIDIDNSAGIASLGNSGHYAGSRASMTQSQTTNGNIQKTGQPHVDPGLQSLEPSTMAGDGAGRSS